MCPTDRFVVMNRAQGPVYSSDTIRGVIAYLWGRDVTQHVVFVYETPVLIESPNLDRLDRVLYETVLTLTYPNGVETPLY